MNTGRHMNTWTYEHMNTCKCMNKWTYIETHRQTIEHTNTYKHMNMNIWKHKNTLNTWTAFTDIVWKHIGKVQELYSTKQGFHLIIVDFCHNGCNKNIVFVTYVSYSCYCRTCELNMLLYMCALVIRTVSVYEVSCTSKRHLYVTTRTRMPSWRRWVDPRTDSRKGLDWQNCYPI